MWVQRHIRNFGGDPFCYEPDEVFTISRLGLLWQVVHHLLLSNIETQFTDKVSMIAANPKRINT